MKKLSFLVSFILLLTNISFGQNFNYVKKITPPNVDSARVAGDNFGVSVSISGNYAVIGSPDSDWDSAGANYKSGAGNAHIWELNPNTGVWGRVKKLSPRSTSASDSPRVSSDFFGVSVAISGDYCIVASRDHDYDSTSSNSSFLSSAGAAYIWERNNAGVWTQVKKICAPDRAGADQFSTRVAIDGNYAVVGAPGHDRDSAGGNFKSNAGAAWIYQRVNGVWGFLKKITPPNTDSARVASDNFGASVAISGNYIVVGANGQDWDSAGGNFKSLAGAVYVFELQNGVWGYVKKLTPPNTDSARVGSDQFGQNVHIDGTTIVVGAVGQDYDSAGGDLKLQAGAAYVFERNNGVWGYVEKITPPSNTSDSARMVGDGFSNSVSISGDVILVGASQQDWDSVGGSYKSTAGAAYEFRKNGGVWNYSKKIAPPNTDSARVAGDRFGTAVAVSGSYAIISSGTAGAGNDWDSVGGSYKSNAGAAYLYYANTCNLTYNNGWVGSSPSGSTGTCNCTIAAGTATIASGAALASLSVSSGATASLSGNLSITGGYTNNGTVSGAGTIVLNGSTQQTIGGTGTTTNLTLNNSAGAQIQDSLKISGVLTHTSGTLTTNNKLVLKATSYTQYGQIAGSGSGTISGNVKAEMMVSGTRGTDGAWYQFCSPLGGNTLADLADDIYLSYNTSPLTALTVYELDETLSGTGHALTKSVWKPATSSTNISSTGVLAWIPNANAHSGNNVVNTLDVSGTYTKNNVTYSGLTRTGSVSDSTGWHLVANPWPSGYDHNGASITNLAANTIYVYNNGSVGAHNGTTGTGIMSSTSVIPPFQAMYVQMSSTNDLTFSASQRTTTTGSFFSKRGIADHILINVEGAPGSDNAVVYSDPKAENDEDFWDAAKVFNSPFLPNIYTIAGSGDLGTAINVRNNMSEAVVEIPVGFRCSRDGAYKISVDMKDMVDPTAKWELVDLLDSKSMQITSVEDTLNFAHKSTNADTRFVLRKSNTGTVRNDDTHSCFTLITSSGTDIRIGTLAEEMTYAVYDLNGRVVRQGSKAGNPTTVIPMEGEAPGIYVVTTLINGTTVKSQKVIIE